MIFLTQIYLLKTIHVHFIFRNNLKKTNLIFGNNIYYYVQMFSYYFYRVFYLKKYIYLIKKIYKYCLYAKFTFAIFHENFANLAKIASSEN